MSQVLDHFTSRAFAVSGDGIPSAQWTKFQNIVRDKMLEDPASIQSKREYTAPKESPLDAFNEMRRKVADERRSAILEVIGDSKLTRDEIFSRLKPQHKSTQSYLYDVLREMARHDRVRSERGEVNQPFLWSVIK